MQKQTIKVSNLKLDLDNSRFPEQPDSQRDALIKMVELQGDKLVSLATDIIEHGIDPSERLIVLKDSEDSYIVSEGNRRLTTLKLMNQPEIIGENGTVKKIKRLLKSNPIIPAEVDCVVFENEEDFEHWIRLKHTGENQGAGRVRWTGQESDRYRAKHGSTSFGNQLLSFIRSEEKVADSISVKSQRLKITNLNRLLGDPYVRKSLGLSSPVNGILFCDEHKDSFIYKISLILDCMLESDDKGKVIFTVDRIRMKQDRADFVNQLGIEASGEKLERAWRLDDPRSFVEPTPKSTNGVASNNDGSPSSDPSEQQNPSDSGNGSKKNESTSENADTQTDRGATGKGSVKQNPNRNNLVPANVRLKITDKKCSGIFKELKSELRHDRAANSIAVMVRVFLDLSLTFYIENNNLRLDDRKSGLHDKVVKVTSHLENQGKLTKKLVTSIQAASASTLKSNGSLQQYVHNNHMFPDKSSINTTWDNFEPLLVGIWS